MVKKVNKDIMEFLDTVFVNRLNGVATNEPYLESLGFDKRIITQCRLLGLIIYTTRGDELSDYYLTDKGFDYLTQLKIEKSTNKLDESVQILNNTTKKLKKSTSVYLIILIIVAVSTLVIGIINAIVYIKLS